MGEAAVKIAREIGYNNAGTVEFLVDKDLNFYFLEMNTRVQVEHPVTEMVTKVDIVREQILIAAGNKLSFKQEDLKQHGHAIECRIYAEDPANNFMPSPGDMSLYLEPEGENIRIDTGIGEATTIHSFYDPMISKLVVWGEDREIAREKMILALKSYIVHGIRTNISFLKQVIQHKAYITNKITTKYCDEHTSDIIQAIETEKKTIPVHLPVIAFLIYGFYQDLLMMEEKDFSVWNAIGYWRDLMEIKGIVDEMEFEMKIPKASNGRYNLEMNGSSYNVVLKSMEEGIIEIVNDGQASTFYISTDKKGNGFVSYSGHIFTVKRNDVIVTEDIFGSIDHGGKDHGEIVSPMPGKVIKINVKEGKHVKKGDVLMVVEAMKMENSIVAFKEGIIQKIYVKTGDMVDGSKELVILDDIK